MSPSVVLNCVAVAGFSMDDLNVQVEANQLLVRGKQAEDADKVYLHRGIAGRQFQRTFVLAEGIEVVGAELDNGLLHIDLERPLVESRVQTVAIKSAGGSISAETIDGEAEAQIPGKTNPARAKS